VVDGGTGKRHAPLMSDAPQGVLVSILPHEELIARIDAVGEYFSSQGYEVRDMFGAGGIKVLTFTPRSPFRCLRQCRTRTGRNEST
jgi:hypothetical protein